MKVQTNTKCHECDKECSELVHFGDEPDYDCIWQDLCAECLQRGLDLLKPAPGCA